LVLVEREVALARTAHRTEPGVGDLLERRAGGDAAVGVAVLGVVDVAAGLADPALEGLRGRAHSRLPWLVSLMCEEYRQGRVSRCQRASGTSAPGPARR